MSCNRHKIVAKGYFIVSKCVIIVAKCCVIIAKCVIEFWHTSPAIFMSVGESWQHWNIWGSINMQNYEHAASHDQHQCHNNAFDGNSSLPNLCNNK
jgi:hypothetical protein